MKTIFHTPHPKLAFLALSVFVLACNKPSQPEGSSSGQPTDSAGNTTANSQPAPVASQAPVPDASYEILHNMEMIEYCLPYPKADFEESFELSEGKAQHVLLSKSKDDARITFSGNMLDMGFDELYQLCLDDIQSLTGAAPLSQEQQADAFSLSWMADGNRVYMKKWYRKGEQETVTAKIEYPQDQGAYYDKVIATIAAHSSMCE